LYEQALELAKARLGPDHPSTLTSMSNLAVGYWRKGQLDKSIPLFEEVLQRRERKFGRSHPDTLLTIGNLGVNYRDSGRLSEAIPLLEEATSAVSNYPRLDGVQNELRKAYLRAKRIAEFGGMVDKQLFEARQRLVDNPPELASLLASISSELLQIGDYPKAEVLLVECVEIRQQTTPDTWTTFNAQSMLGGAILEQAIQLMNSQKETVTEPEVNQHATARKLADALPLLVAGYEGMKQRADQIPPDARIRLTEAVDRLIEHAAATNNTAELKKWQAERATYGPRSAD
jgi:tetratricopeptide (TPR) repeat protein